jgi:hypothetical protein
MPQQLEDFKTNGILSESVLGRFSNEDMENIYQLFLL